MLNDGNFMSSSSLHYHLEIFVQPEVSLLREEAPRSVSKCPSYQSRHRGIYMYRDVCRISNSLPCPLSLGRESKTNSGLEEIVMAAYSIHEEQYKPSVARARHLPSLYWKEGKRYKPWRQGNAIYTKRLKKDIICFNPSGES